MMIQILTHKNMAVVTLAGEFGTGKTTYVKGRLKQIKSNREMMLFARVKNDYAAEIYRDSVAFFKKAVNSKNTVMVLDEAKLALPKNIPDTLNPENPRHQHILRIIDTFINARKLNNLIFIIYHSLSEIPLWLIHYMNMLVRFRTNDQMQYMKTRFASFDKIISSLNKHNSFENFTCQQITLRK